MKFILSESQVSKIILEQIRKKSSKGFVAVSNIIFNIDVISSNDSISKGFVVNSNEETSVSIGLENIASDKSPLIIENVKFSKENLIKDLNFIKTPFGSGKSGFVNFLFSSTNKTSNESVVSLTIYVNFVVANKNIRDVLEIKLIFRVRPQQETLNKCKSKFSRGELNKTIMWVKSWLNNPSTKQRFIKTWNYDKNKVEEIFTEYNKILDQITIKYVYSQRPNQGWVQQSILQTYGISERGYKVPITVNCSTNYETAQSLFVHEIQHILNYYHKFFPYEYSLSERLKTLPSEPSNDNDSDPPDTGKKIYQLLQKEGFDDSESFDIIDEYLWKLKNDEIHLKNPNENISNLWDARKYLNLKPNEPITKRMMIDHYDNEAVMHAICEWLYSKMDFQKWLDLINSIALNKNQQNPNNNLA